MRRSDDPSTPASPDEEGPFFVRKPDRRARPRFALPVETAEDRAIVVQLEPRDQRKPANPRD